MALALSGAPPSISANSRSEGIAFADTSKEIEICLSPKMPTGLFQAEWLVWVAWRRGCGIIGHCKLLCNPAARCGAGSTKARCERAFSRAANLLQQGAEALLDKLSAYHSIP